MKSPIRVVSFAFAVLAFTSALAAGDDCGTPGMLKGKQGDATIALKTRVFTDGSIAVRAPLAVNPDGGPGSYTVGDHGFTYIANGLAQWRNGVRETCDGACMSSFRAAEKVGFAKGSDEFCVFAMTVEALEPGQQKTACKNGGVIGNGKGRLALGELLDTISGGKVQAYASTTSLQHLPSGKKAYLNSETLPIVVTPRTDLLGKVVWVGGKDMTGTFAVIGDQGPAFGEGSIALHQILRRGGVSHQNSGPVPADQRCQAGETNLLAPFQSRPDGGKSDRCQNGFTAKTATDVRAYGGIDTPIDFVILGAAAFTRQGSIIQSEVTPASIEQLATKAGYTQEKIKHMMSCLVQ